MRGRAVSQYAIDSAEQEELTLAGRALAHVGEENNVVAVVEQVRQPPPRLLVPHADSSSRRVARWLRPRRFQLLTEPSGTRSLLAMVVSLKSL